MNRRSRPALGRFAPESNSRRRPPWWVVALTVTLVVGFLFVRGPNGLIRMLAHWRRVKTADSELNVVQQQVDSLRELQRQFGDTAFLHRFAAGIMDGIGKPVPRPDSADAGGAAAGQDLSTSNNGPGLTGN